jgi:fructose transport system permease protein
MSDDTAGSVTAERGLKGATEALASFDESDAGAIRRLQAFLHQFPTSIPFFVLLLGVVIFSIAAPDKFFAPFNFSLVLQQVTIIAVLGVAQTLIILTAGIDLSVGAIMILCSVVMGRTAVVYGVPVLIAFPLGLLCGLACGVVNGLIVTMLRLPPFIVTLGTWSIFGALNVWYSQSETIRQQDMEAAAPFLQWTGTIFKPYDFFSKTLGLDWTFLKGWVLTYGSLVMLILAFVIWYVLNRTALGRHIYATGDDPDAARLRDRRLGADRAHRWRKPAGWPDRKPRLHHRCRDRRHLPVWRPRLDRRNADRRLDRRRLPQRPCAFGA